MYTIVAKQSKHRLLLAKDKKTGRILDLEEKILYPENYLESIVARGYWQDYVGKQNAEELLKDVKVIDDIEELEEAE